MNRECLIVFTRYPEPGKAKTRLIPALGEEGASNLHRQMTEHTLSQVRELQSARATRVEVYFTGGDQQLMEDWLGADIIYQPQGKGDLGQRMKSAFQTAFAAGMEGVAIVGTDCPGLDAKIMAQAFEQLNGHDLVLGPAMDGGYYLIGLRRVIPELFAGINWGTSEVREKTLAIAISLGLAVAYLPPLFDVDRPEDLAKVTSFEF
ncbi:TIGR04282 family arsenosugar biosynthesis glycosyltransferase [Coleofasciculus sp. FACHB-64]|uniref:TIGR04282 family arsenosugar biosynthesis glycosyltransferase n=1 Tax=Cyanophyceae TaxID=3028117 RepID=UPI0016883ECA|nr:MULTISPECIES: TIGR04282 family arsenosugar biosynthesis glycosyltransferase [unclassified Coleofasciculus]MBD1839046.1 TIGR04282 family arsenosugar biosynthesis glycosyltransferase [Coleofasciculus sp. FACHB-501]MBD2048717.1 TIGR04282 family arsenosugar biosynthesis glycosyltransferase [Coleofasciculus sp. FACHB-64]MBD2087737.1 TIGR04282 family arsenosugar biosynthesis glycosyltransferase [Coleofasciculus sp. FACHB-542]